eukprot:CAMPEP_0196574094 /NCGR_PEP_ID=MMETSP1081-20130531/3871_1 /TAXON_ID=36882 /ORGANISM="Pyramimonas amylifera, Strain CCMP720" /LENGTH=385 /DNA_ID=CAMNT_0041891999 /DNA_START=156 /DNA_END=1313 /DNA_ORIENTATION=+
MRHMEFPERHRTAEVCSRWRTASKDRCFCMRVEPHPQAINRAISGLVAGGTIILSPGYYQETIVVSKPVRLIGELHETVRGEARRAVVIEGHSSTAVVCMAQFQLEGVVLRTRRAATGRSSVITFPPNQEPGGVPPSHPVHLCLKNCEVTGTGGLHIPNIPNPPTKLKILDCTFNACQNEEAALTVSGGFALVSGCTFTGNRGSGLLIGRMARAEVLNCDLSFNNRSGIYVAGSGRVAENIFWGNSTTAIDMDPEHILGSCVFEQNHMRPRMPLSMHERIISTYLDQLANPRIAAAEMDEQDAEEDVGIQERALNLDINLEIDNNSDDDEDRDGDEEEQADALQDEPLAVENENGHQNFDLNNLVAQIMMQLNQAMAEDAPDANE